MENEKKIRREIANSNERRRMQSINAGFQSLRNLLPHHEGEKLSKAAILQQTAEYIYHLEQEKTKMVSQNSHLKRLVTANGGTIPTGSGSGIGGAQGSSGSGSETGCSSPNSPAIDMPPTLAKRRKTVDGVVESADEGIGSMSPEHSGSNEELMSELNELRRETMDLRLQLERERRHRIGLEEYIGMLQQQQQQLNIPNEIEVKIKMEGDDSQVQHVEEVETFDPAQQQTVRIIHDETPRCYTIRNNLETIVEAIRHLEGDHLFTESDDRNNSTPSSSPPSASPPRGMEICVSPVSPGDSPSHQPFTTCIVFNPSRPTRQM